MRPGRVRAHEPGDQADALLPLAYFTAELRLVGSEGAGVIIWMVLRDER
ncbi:hypothetical protein [Nocardia brasiliensis]|nr:hypothetical protein [Nocardia brasiliensis]